MRHTASANWLLLFASCAALVLQTVPHGSDGLKRTSSAPATGKEVFAPYPSVWFPFETMVVLSRLNSQAVVFSGRGVAVEADRLVRCTADGGEWVGPVALAPGDAQWTLSRYTAAKPAPKHAGAARLASTPAERQATTHELWLWLKRAGHN